MSSINNNNKQNTHLIFSVRSVRLLVQPYISPSGPLSTFPTYLNMFIGLSGSKNNGFWVDNRLNISAWIFPLAYFRLHCILPIAYFRLHCIFPLALHIFPIAYFAYFRLHCIFPLALHISDWICPTNNLPCVSLRFLAFQNARPAPSFRTFAILQISNKLVHKYIYIPLLFPFVSPGFCVASKHFSHTASPWCPCNKLLGAISVLSFSLLSEKQRIAEQSSTGWPSSTCDPTDMTILKNIPRRCRSSKKECLKIG